MLGKYGYYRKGKSDIFFKEKGSFVQVKELKKDEFEVLRIKDNNKLVSGVGFYQPIIRLKPSWAKQ